MKNRDIYDSALRILAEKTVSGANDDYEERAPYLIATFCTESHEADKIYRKAHSLSMSSWNDAVYLDLEDSFPLSTRFASVAAVYLASMLVIDENFELSDKLFEKYSDMMSSICAQLPANVEAIANRYVF